MIDARRWILVEAWLSLGLRIEWCSSWEHGRIEKDAWLEDDGDSRRKPTRFVYTGNRLWQVERERDVYGRPPNMEPPQLSTDALRHELAHYLTASEDERACVNFGASPAIGPGNDPKDTEDRALAAEKVIEAMLAASARIANMALGGRS